MASLVTAAEEGLDALNIALVRLLDGLVFESVPGLHLTIFLFLAHELAYVVCNIPYVIIYYLNAPFFEARALQRNRKRSPSLVWGTIGYVVMLQIFVILPAIAVAFGVRCHFAASRCLRPRPSPSLWQFLFNVGASLVIEDVVFYCIHRSLHSKPLYKLLHKKHHRFTAPYAWASEYAHPVELLVGNVFPLVLGPAILDADIVSFSAWLWLRIYLTTEVHSGYRLPWSLETVLSVLPVRLFAGASHHDKHHEMFNANFGSTLQVISSPFTFGFPGRSWTRAWRSAGNQPRTSDPWSD